MSIDPVIRFRLDIIAELLERSSERIQLLAHPTAAEYSQTILEIQAIIGRIDQLIAAAVVEQLPPVGKVYAPLPPIFSIDLR
jgi:hypothetical protein